MARRKRSLSKQLSLAAMIAIPLGLALLVLSYDSLFACNAAAFVVSMACVLSVSLPRPTPSERGPGAYENIAFGIDEDRDMVLAKRREIAAFLCDFFDFFEPFRIGQTLR